MTVLCITGALPLSAQKKVLPRGAVTDHVIIVSIDGLRPDAITAYGANNMLRLMKEGAHATDAQTVLPAKTLPSHVSMLSGLPPSVHGVAWNDDQTENRGYVEVETVFETVKGAGFSTAAFFSKPKFRHLQKPGSLDYSQAPRGLETWLATRTVVDAITYLGGHEPGLLFVHIAEPDFAGHTVGFMSFAYGWAVRRADGALGSLLKAADASFGKGNYTVIVTADHGGEDRDHGEDTPEDRTIPWIAWGRGVEHGVITSRVNTFDTAATVLWLLGVAEPALYDGTAVVSAFTPAARLAATEAAAARLVH